MAIIELPKDEGWSHARPIKSTVWVRLARFATKKQAEAHAARIGWRRCDVQRRFGRFEYAWLLVDPHGGALLKQGGA